MNLPGEQELRDVTNAWDRAMIGNDADEIGRYMADDWTIVGPDGSIGGKEAFLALVRSGDLTHDAMDTAVEPEDMRIRIYGDTAIVIAAGISAGHFQGDAFFLKERSTCIFVIREGRWLCVHTHLSSLNDSSISP
jgi:ketosteroid isomerase-like protein